MIQATSPIGVFDSGVGGLTVLSALKNALPNEHFIYLGDTARLPYGTKSPETVRQYALNAASLLIKKGVKLIVVACNTASSVAMTDLQHAFAPIPVIGVIEPAVHACVEELGPSCNVGVIATESTIKWHAYRKAFESIASGYHVQEWPCSLLVALAEQGWTKGSLTQEIIHTLLRPFLEKNQDIAALILGCTHFPVFKDAFMQIMPVDTLIIDSAQWVAKSVVDTLVEMNLFNQSNQPQQVQYMVTDNPERFVRLGPIFLQHDLDEHIIDWVHLDKAA